MLNEIEADPGTSAMLHGMLSTLSEVLGGLERRLDGIEESLTITRHDAVKGARKGAEDVRDSVLGALTALAERIDHLEARVERPDPRGAALEALVKRLDALGAGFDELRVQVAGHRGEVGGAVAEFNDAVREAIATASATAAAAIAEEQAAEFSRLRDEVVALGRQTDLVDLRDEVAALGRQTDLFDLRDGILGVGETLRAVQSRQDDLLSGWAAVQDRQGEAIERILAGQRDLAEHIEGVARGLAEDSTAATLRASVDTIGETLVAMRAADAADAEAISRLQRHLDALAAEAGGIARLHEALDAMAADRITQAGIDAALSTLADAVQNVGATAQEALQSSHQSTEALGRLSTAVGSIEAHQPAIDAVAAGVAGMAAGLERLDAALTDHPAAHLHEAMADVTTKVDSLVAQPGPGPAMAMVAAGLAERFESRTDALTGTLEQLVDALASTNDRMEATAREGAALGRQLVDQVAALLDAGFGAVAGDAQSVRAALDRLAAAAGADHDDIVELRAAVSTVVDETRRSMTGHLAAMDERQSASDDALHGLAAALGNYQATVAELGAAVQGPGGVTDAVAELGASVIEATGELRQAVSDLPATTAASVGVSVSESSEMAARQLQAALSATSAAIEVTLAASASEVRHAMADAVTSMATGQDQVSRAIDQLRVVVDGQGSTAGALQAAIEALAGTVEATAGSINGAIGEGFFDAAARHAAVVEGLQRLGAVIDGERADMDGLQAAMAAIVASSERAGTITGQVAELLLENRAALRDEVERLDAAVRGQVEMIAGRTMSTEQVVLSLDERLRQLDLLVQGIGASLQSAGQTSGEIEDALGDAVSTVRADLESLRASASAQAEAVARVLAELHDRTAGDGAPPAGAEVSDVVRREAELLTQRVAALSVMLESIRAMMAAHAEETANSLGRKATEVGRRLAGDLGIRPKKTPAKRPAKNREIGPGA